MNSKRAGNEERDADDQGAGIPDDVCKTTSDRTADRASLVTAEGDHQTERTDRQTGPKRLQVDDLAPHEHETPDCDQHEWNDVCGGAERAVEPVGDLRPDRATIPPEPHERREEEADRDHPESPELGMVMRSGLGRSALPDTSRGARLGCPLDGLLPGRCHRGCCFCGSVPYPPPHPGRPRDRGRRSARGARALRHNARARASSMINSASVRLPKPLVSVLPSSRSL